MAFMTYIAAVVLQTTAASTITARRDADIESLHPIHKTITYGTYDVPPRSQDNGMLRFKQDHDPPCTDCLITSISVNIQYPDGTTADPTNGMWMHHMTFANKGRLDGVCGDQQPAQRFFGAGNDRSPLDLTIGGTHQIGYHIAPHDTLLLSAELMNFHSSSQRIILTATWSYVLSSSPLYTQYAPAMPFWLSVSGCVAADMPAAADSEFTYSSPAFILSPTSDNATGVRHLAWLGNHVHDGAKLQNVTRNGAVICSSEAEYGAESGVDGIAHFEQMPFCTDLGPVESEDEFVVTVEYDTKKWKPMVNEDGTLEGVMGIVLAWVVDSGVVDGGIEVENRDMGGFGVAIGVVMVVTVALLVGWFMLVANRGRKNVWWKSSRYDEVTMRYSRLMSLQGPRKSHSRLSAFSPGRVPHGKNSKVQSAYKNRYKITAASSSLRRLCEGEVSTVTFRTVKASWLLTYSKANSDYETPVLGKATITRDRAGQWPSEN
ncbi:hypothetical protein DOTSEDRAFT_36893 [Dothistroma septosporum NZE10]|uniref:Uncharacterized protein n=1 Tax=Dothistroma septosporum (strain NZE10 / CBS 128990) TaxID=675120 RepID=N1PGJ7_DOTSN|nr:hypothetical protein DOTSEDRAFT_36893 [Dothistroma septosporum NZE10]